MQRIRLGVPERAVSPRRAPLAFALLLLLSLPRVAAGQGYVYPDPDWKTADPAQMGMDPGKLQFALKKAFGHVICIRSGYVVGTKGDVAKRYPVYSASKAITSLVFGRLLQLGLVDYGQGVPGSDYPKKPMATFRQFLAMTSDYGLDPHAPGQHYAYNNMAYDLLGKTLAASFGTQDPVAVVDQALFQFTGRDDALTFSGLWGGWNGGFETSARDLARLGYLVLRRGHWKNQQILPESFVDELYLPQIPPSATMNTSQGTGPTEGSPGNNWWNQYAISQVLPGNWSLGWWTNFSLRWPGLPKNSIYAEGLHDHRIFVSPDHDLVVVNVFGDGFFNPQEVFGPFVDAVVGPPPPPPTTVTVSGDLQVDHTVTLSFDGVAASESDPAWNPFLDARLDVTFQQGSATIVVPGFFAADGDAAQTGASAGSVWKVRFVPPTAGTWHWVSSFRIGPGVAVDDSPSAGSPGAFDGLSGSFDVVASQAPPGSPSARGRLLADGEGWLRFERTGEPFLRVGLNSPENLLAYADFDDAVAKHTFAPHVVDWQPGDPEWGASRGRGLIGALDYLAGRGIDSITVVLLDALGGGQDVWPFVSSSDPTRYDVSRLAQWEVVLSHAEALGLHLQLVLQGAGDGAFLDQGTLGPQRRLFLREMVARFSHHLALTWNLGDEYALGAGVAVATASRLRTLDPLDHPIFVGAPLVGADALLTTLLGREEIDGVGLHVPKFSLAASETAIWREASAEAGRRWVVAVDQAGPVDLGVAPDEVDPTHDVPRKELLWRTLFRGAGGVDWYFGPVYPEGDLTLEDFRSRDLLYGQGASALEFFRSVVDPSELAPLAGAGRPLGIPEPTEEVSVLAKPGVRYVVFSEVGAPVELFLDQPGFYEVRWFDPTAVGSPVPGSVHAVTGPGWRSLGLPPYAPGGDWVALVERVDTWLTWYGTGLAGTGGLEPQIGADEPYLGNLGFLVHLFQTAPNSLAVLLVGAKPVAVPAFGGVIWNDAQWAVYLVPTSSIGRATLNFQLADNPAAAGTSLYFQWIVADPQAPAGLAFTEGMEALLH